MNSDKPIDERANDELTNEAGSIGQEQMPAYPGLKTDKAPWNLSAKSAKHGDRDEHDQEFFKRGAGM